MMNFSKKYTGKKTDWDEIFLKMAFDMASASHCVSRQVAAIVTKDKRIISTGINGTPEGCINCDELFPPKTDPNFNREEHHNFSKAFEIHAEMNATIFAAKETGNMKGGTLYCTTQPCSECLKNLMQVGLVRIVYAEEYDLAGCNPEIYNMLKQKGIKLEYKPINHDATNPKQNNFVVNGHAYKFKIMFKNLIEKVRF